MPYLINNKKYNLRNHGYLLMLFIVIVFSSGCKKFLDIDPPPDKIDKTGAFESDATAIATITGIYHEMINNSQQFSSGFTTLFCGMAADELNYYSQSFRDEFIANDITENNHSNLTTYFWSPAYKFIYSANLAIEQLNLSSRLTPSVKETLLGEAKFIRAFNYFYLVNLFGDVPLILASDYKINNTQPRSPLQKVYEQIISDLTEAKNSLPATYPTPDRGRPNKWTATALLSRVYLFTMNWAMAESEAGSVISSGTYVMNTDLSKVFLKGSSETIWQLITGNPSVGTWEAFYLLPATSSSTPTYILTNGLFNSFEANDNRKSTWIGTRTFASQTIRYPAKYKMYPTSAGVTEHYIVLRLAEQYLTRAEARANQNKIPEAISDLNIVRLRAGLAATIANDQASLLEAISKERRIELFAEWGHRWMDLKRTNKADAILGTLKPTWQPTDALWPIPGDQINLNPALIQNPGY